MSKDKEQKDNKNTPNIDNIDKKETKTDKIKETQPEHSIEELTHLLKRVQADFDNYRKRVEKVSIETKNRAAADTIFKLLPILDSFELAFKNTKNHHDFVKGTELIYSQLFSLLEQLGLRQIQTKNTVFDPYKHEVLLQQESDKEEGTILEELQKGYMLNDMVLRTAKVKLSKGKIDDKKTDTTQ